jgi:Ca-activated chloride channel family protein
MRAAVVVLFACSAVTTTVAQQPIRTGIDLVHFSVIVADKQGTPVVGFKPDDFELVEEGKLQTITYFAEGFPEHADLGTVLPFHLGLALDTSGSMDPDIKDVRRAVIKFLNANEHAADTTLVDFDTEVRLARYGTADYPRIIERIRTRKPDGWTAFYDAVGVYLSGAAEQDGEKVLLVYTDGGDTRSSITYHELLDLLKASDVTAYVIGYLEHQPQSVRTEQRMQLQHMAELTGGDAFFPSSVKELDRIYERIQRTMAARYSLGYVSSDARMDGSWRKVQIRLKRPDLKGVKLRTREGYFAPYKATPSGVPPR